MAKPSPSLRWNEVISKSARCATTVARTPRDTERRAGSWSWRNACTCRSITLIDTPGAYPGVESEERGLASELAGSLARMSTLRTPIVSAVIGEGGSGGALALAVADRVLMLDGAIYSVIAPEGAAAILYRDAARAPEISSKLKLTARELKRLNVVDEIVPEPDDRRQTLIRMRRQRCSPSRS